MFKRQVAKGGLGGFGYKKNQQKKLPAQQQNTASRYTTSSSSQKVQNFSIQMGRVFDQTDRTIAWGYTVPSFAQNQREIILSVGKFSTTMFDYMYEQIPSTISIGIRGFSGFVGTNGNLTNRVIVMNLVNIEARQIGGKISRDLTYQFSCQVAWNLGTNRQLIFQVQTDDDSTPLSMPTPNSFNVMFKIIHVIW